MEKTREQIHKERNEPLFINPTSVGMTSDNRRPDIEGYIPPKSINAVNKKNIYSTYSDTGDCPYAQGTTPNKYAGYTEKSGYRVQNCFKCEKSLTDCSCQIKTSKK